jgi:hypothetical protein
MSISFIPQLEVLILRKQFCVRQTEKSCKNIVRNKKQKQKSEKCRSFDTYNFNFSFESWIFVAWYSGRSVKLIKLPIVKISIIRANKTFGYVKFLFYYSIIKIYNM